MTSNWVQGYDARGRRRRLLFEQILAEAGTSFFTASFGPSPCFEFNWHQHPELEFALVTKGRGRRYVGDALEPFADGDLVLLGSDLPHSWHTDPADGEVASMVIQFRPDVFGGFLGAPELRPVMDVVRRSARGLALHGRTRDEVERLFIRVVETPPSSWRRVTGLIEALGRIAESAEVREITRAAPTPSAGEADPRIDRVFALLNGPLDEIPSQASAARAAKLSPAAFSRFFRRAVGKTYVACVTELRVLAACRELIEGDKPIIDVAFGAGFENLSNFNRRFRALKGTTPRAFRAAARAAEASRTG